MILASYDEINIKIGEQRNTCTLLRLSFLYFQVFVLDLRKWGIVNWSGNIYFYLIYLSWQSECRKICMDACKHKHAHTVCVMDALFCDHYLWMKGSKISSRHANLIFGSPEMNAAGVSAGRQEWSAVSSLERCKWKKREISPVWWKGVSEQLGLLIPAVCSSKVERMWIMRTNDIL